MLHIKIPKLKPPSRYTKLFLRIALPMLVTSLVTLLISYLQMRDVDPILATNRCQPLLEYPVAGIALTAGGAVLIELVSREGTE
ncbi:MAG: hypothetical protein E7637_08020 [Ruminococcaceae bacterium]|nr:hypothetical protein [Oscillospiraceae bacterium]